jgi:2-keto-3-deoxy-L-rhamnonate aldolase RhmA
MPDVPLGAGGVPRTEGGRLLLENRVKRIVADGGMALATFGGGLRGPEIVELVGHAGYDGVFIDMEHMAHDLRDVQTMVLAAERMGITPIVRTPGLDAALVLRLLDLGVQGIYAPHVSTAAAARALVAAARYTPLGERGLIGYGRAADYGGVPLERHIEQSNREVLLAVMIEDRQGVEEIEAITAVEGIDLIAPGPNDLAGTLGVPGQADHPALVAAMNRIVAAVRKAGGPRLALPLGHPVYPRTVAECRELGVGLLLCGTAPEARLLRAMSEEVADVRRAMTGR